MKTVIPVDGVLAYEPFGFTNCVRHGDVLYLSGISGLNADGSLAGEDIEAQTVKTFENIEKVLKAGGSSMEQILQMTGFVVDLERNGSRYVEARKKVLASRTYTSATIGVEKLMMKGLLLEVQCIAAVG